jgi:hypothetical protein
MIIRQYAQCEECRQAHVLRIGIGSEPDPAHRFACVSCGEEMGLQLKNGSGTVWGANTRQAEADDSALHRAGMRKPRLCGSSTIQKARKPL